MELHERPGPFFPEEELPELPRCGLNELPPADMRDPVIEAYKKDVDRTLLRENLKLTPEERSRKFERMMALIDELRRAGQQLRGTRTPRT